MVSMNCLKKPIYICHFFWERILAKPLARVEFISVKYEKEKNRKATNYIIAVLDANGGSEPVLLT